MGPGWDSRPHRRVGPVDKLVRGAAACAGPSATSPGAIAARATGCWARAGECFMRLATASTCVVAWMVVCTPGSLEAQTVRASVSSSGAQSLGGTWVAGTRVAASADGRVIAFDSPVDSLVNDDHNGHRDVFIAADGVITRALPAGVQPNGPSSSPSVSADGRYVVFASEAINLVPGDEYPYSEVLLFDRQNPTGLTLVSVVQHPANQGIDTATRPAISPNARYVAFMATGYGLRPTPSPCALRCHSLSARPADRSDDRRRHAQRAVRRQVRRRPLGGRHRRGRLHFLPGTARCLPPLRCLRRSPGHRHGHTREYPGRRSHGRDGSRRRVAVGRWPLRELHRCRHPVRR